MLDTASVCNWLGAELEKRRGAHSLVVLSNIRFIIIIIRLSVLEKFACVINTTHEVHQIKPIVLKTVTCIIHIEMSRHLPKFITVCDSLVPVTNMKVEI